MHSLQILLVLPLLQVLLHPLTPSLQNLHLEQGPLGKKKLEQELGKGSGKILTLFDQSRVCRDYTGHTSHRRPGRHCSQTSHTAQVSLPFAAGGENLVIIDPIHYKYDFNMVVTFS